MSCRGGSKRKRAWVVVVLGALMAALALPMTVPVEAKSRDNYRADKFRKWQAEMEKARREQEKSQKKQLEEAKKAAEQAARKTQADFNRQQQRMATPKQ